MTAKVSTELPFKSKQPPPADLESIKLRNELSENQWREKKPHVLLWAKHEQQKSNKISRTAYSEQIVETNLHGVGESNYFVK